MHDHRRCIGGIDAGHPIVAFAMEDVVRRIDHRAPGEGYVA
jgi:hypothetical protein